jgi:amino acid permease
MVPDAMEAGLPWKNILYCYFISIAAVIGTGILAIPVKLYETGFWPFSFLFTVCVLMLFFFLIVFFSLY